MISISTSPKKSVLQESAVGFSLSCDRVQGRVYETHGLVNYRRNKNFTRPELLEGKAELCRTSRREAHGTRFLLSL